MIKNLIFLSLFVCLFVFCFCFALFLGRSNWQSDAISHFLIMCGPAKGPSNTCRLSQSLTYDKHLTIGRRKKKKKKGIASAAARAALPVVPVILVFRVHIQRIPIVRMIHGCTLQFLRRRLRDSINTYLYSRITRQTHSAGSAPNVKKEKKKIPSNAQHTNYFPKQSRKVISVADEFKALPPPHGEIPPRGGRKTEQL